MSPYLDIRDKDPQALIDKGACLACLTYEKNPQIGSFCSRACQAYYLFCNDRLYKAQWRYARSLAQQDFMISRRVLREAFTEPKQISVSD